MRLAREQAKITSYCTILRLIAARERRPTRARPSRAPRAGRVATAAGAGCSAQRAAPSTSELLQSGR